MDVAPQLLGTAVADAPISWEEVPCPLCERRHGSILLQAPDPQPGGKGLWFAVVQCQECGLCFTNPRPRPESIRQFYPPAYQPHQPAAVSRKRWFRRRRTLPGWLTRKHQPIPLQGQGRLLDFGCGSGAFLKQMEQLGWQVTGVDLAAAPVERLRQQLGLRAFTGSLPHPNLHPRSFDVVTMWHSLEHVHAPRLVLKAAHDLLVPGGKLVVTVPNIDSLPFRWFGSAWSGLDLPRHLTHFAPATLLRMLVLSGFEIESLRMVRHSSWLRTSARLAAAHGQKRLCDRLLRNKPLSRLLSWYCFLTGQADAMMVVAVRGSGIGIRGEGRGRRE